MAKYTEEQLIELKSTSHVSQPTILQAFNAMIEEVKQHALLQQQQYIQSQQSQSSSQSSQTQNKWNNGDTYIDERGNERSYNHLNRRRNSNSRSNNGTSIPSSSSSTTSQQQQPFIGSNIGNLQQQRYNKKKIEIKKDEDGWESFTTNSNSTSNQDQDLEKKDNSNTLSGSGASVGIRARPNNKNLGSSKAVDPREIISDKQTRSFNAFEALDDNDDDDDDSEEEED
ncbi:CAF20 [Candida pseudojiufengensis]|uniref:CAF20 n=1 Tax=Candida pseudojiufengensis TaxID=497109 RepID=UPI002224D4D9|nr:CAF20 [Candida pseudojiufengensis]KAI5960563.1 CAF20 [Candida pseudojiufengensis]